MANSVAPINEAVAFLDEYSPNTLQDLRNEFPDLGPHLEPGGIAGPADGLLVQRALVCIETLRQLEVMTVKGISEAERRLHVQRRLALGGGVAAAVASASVVVSLAADYPVVAFISGLISLAGSLATLLAEYNASTPRKSLSLYEVYNELVQIRSDSRILSLEIQSLLDIGPDEEHEQELTQHVGRANAHFRRAHELLALLLVAGSSHQTGAHPWESQPEGVQGPITPKASA